MEAAPGAAPARRGPAAVRAVVAIVCALVGFGAAWLGLGRGLTAAGIEPPELAVDLVDRLPTARDLASRSPGEKSLLYLGDSTVANDGRLVVPRRLARELARSPSAHARSLRVVAFARPGLDPFAYYFLADEIIARRPDVVLLCINLTTLSPMWRDTVARPDVSGWVRAERLGEAAFMPLHWAHLTADQLLRNAAVVGLGGQGIWSEARRLQSQLARLRPAVAQALSEDGEAPLSQVIAAGLERRREPFGGERGSADRRPPARVRAAALRPRGGPSSARRALREPSRTSKPPASRSSATSRRSTSTCCATRGCWPMAASRRAWPCSSAQRVQQVGTSSTCMRRFPRTRSPTRPPTSR